MVKPVSLVALSVQSSLTCGPACERGREAVGAAGMAGMAIVAVFDQAELDGTLVGADAVGVACCPAATVWST